MNLCEKKQKQGWLVREVLKTLEEKRKLGMVVYSCYNIWDPEAEESTQI